MARRPSSQVNLAAIARHLDISISTASRALRNAEGIHPDTRKRVLMAAGWMGYEMPHLARLDAQPRPHQIMALSQSVALQSDLYYLRGMSRASVAMNLSIHSHHVSPEESRNILDYAHQPVAMRAGMVEAVVLIHRWPMEVASALAQRFPTVSVVHQYPGAKIDYVGIDDRMGVGTLVSHLVKGGHDKIGFYGYCAEMSWSRSRFAAYVESLMAEEDAFEEPRVVGVPLASALAHEEYQLPATERTQVRQAVKSGVTGWIAASSSTANSLVRFLLEEGWELPRDVAVASCHQNPSQANQLPAITTYRIADEELGGAALRRLLHRLKNTTEPLRSIIFPPDFWQGETTRAV